MMASGDPEEECSRLKIAVMNQWAPEGGNKKVPRGTPPNVKEESTRLNPFGFFSALSRVPVKEAPGEGNKVQSASSSSGGTLVRKALPPVPPGYRPQSPQSPPAKENAKGSMPAPPERPASLLVKPAPPIYGDSCAKMLRNIMDDARIS